ncbi:hypothetical protein [Arenimonas sp.]|uniref:hypothetical protein n=1 Tax=Arenimonas sp. TaxID=1872635 RepID=UPI0039E29057
MTACRRKALWLLLAALACLGLPSLSAALGWPLADMTRGLWVGLGVGGIIGALLVWWLPDMSDSVPRALSRRYLRELMPAMGVYVGVMLVWRRLLGMVDAAWLRVVVALLPVLLVAWVMRAFVRYVRDSDEMQRRIELESGAIAALLLSGGYMAAGFLQTAAIIDVSAKVAMLWVFPLLSVLYGVVKVFIARRYG